MSDYFILLIPAILGAQLILTLVLRQGEICPGQRGRVHKMLPVLLAGWLAVTIKQPLAVLPLLALLYFTIKVKTGKTRDAGPQGVLYIANALGGICWLVMALRLDIPEIAISFVAIALYGSALAHVLLTFARTRLQAFHRILPFTGFVSAILTIVLMLWQLMSMNEVNVTQQRFEIITLLALMLSGLVVWAGHLLLSKTVNRWQLLVACLLLTCSALIQVSLF